MKEIHIITPVKDSIDTTIETVESIMSSQLSWPHSYTIYNDNSTPENTLRLKEQARVKKFNLINLSDLTSTPSPNYRIVLQDAQKRALEANAGLLIVESDVIVAPDTLERLANASLELPNCGIAAAVTVDDNGKSTTLTFMLGVKKIRSLKLESIAASVAPCLRLSCLRHLILAN